MSDNMYKEAMEELQDILFETSTNMESLVINLQNGDDYEKSSDTLFRYFHNIKILSQYTRVLNIYKTAKIVEEILSIVRHKKPPFPDELIDWLLLIKDFVSDWSNEFEIGNFDVIAVDNYTLNMAQSSLSTIPKDRDILIKLDVVLFYKEKTKIKRFNDATETLVHKTEVVSNTKELLIHLSTNKPHIIIIPMVVPKVDVFALIEKIQKLHPSVPIILIRNKDLSVDDLKKFAELDTESFMEIDTDEETIRQQLLWIAKSTYGMKGIKLLKSPLLKDIAKLSPLPQTIQKVQEFRKDLKSSMRELSTTVSQDMPLSGRLLQFVNSPGIGLIRNITSVHQAVSLLGKEKTIALATQAALKDSVKIDVSAYGMSEEQFYEVGQKRMMLVTSWYSKVRLSDTAMLATAALLGNIGQVVLSAEVKKRNIEKEFMELVNSTNTMFAEVELLYTTVEDTTADILTHWGLESEMVNAIRYSLDIASADNETKQLAIALFVTFKTIPLHTTSIDMDTVDEMIDFLKEMNLDANHYLKAVKSVL